MRKIVYVALEHRFYEFDGKLYSKLAFPYSYWKDYLTYFDSVVIVARVNVVRVWDDKFIRVDGESVQYAKVPYYLGPKDFFLKLPSIMMSLYRISCEGDKFLLRSGNVTNCLWLLLQFKRKVYIREYPGNVKEGVIGFTGDTFKNRFFASLMDLQAKLHARYSRANSFVSEDCKKLYSSDKPSYVFSSFNSDEINYQKTEYEICSKAFQIVFVGRLEGEKGHSDAIKAISFVNSHYDFKVRAVFIGDGSKKEPLKAQSDDLNVDSVFLGSITDRAKLFDLISQSDLYVIPSHTEGMPRSLLEAMAIGIPCLGSNVGGIPEVLQREALFEPRAINDLADKIVLFYNDIELRKFHGEKNRKLIKERFSQQVLSIKKHQFWNSLYE